MDFPPPVYSLTAETIFDARWAMTLLQEAMTRLGNQYTEQGKAHSPGIETFFRSHQRPCILKPER